MKNLLLELFLLLFCDILIMIWEEKSFAYKCIIPDSLKFANESKIMGYSVYAWRKLITYSKHMEKDQRTWDNYVLSMSCRCVMYN